MAREIQEVRQNDPDTYDALQVAFADMCKHENIARMIETMKTQLSKIRHLAGLVDFAKMLDADAQALKNLLDKRQKYSTAVKILLRMAFFYRSFDHIAKILTERKYGGKWLSAIKTDPDLDRLLSKIQCPCCGFSFEKWLEKAKECERRGLEMPPISAEFCNSVSHD